MIDGEGENTEEDGDVVKRPMEGLCPTTAFGGAADAVVNSVGEEEGNGDGDGDGDGADDDDDEGGEEAGFDTTV